MRVCFLEHRRPLPGAAPPLHGGRIWAREGNPTPSAPRPAADVPRPPQLPCAEPPQTDVSACLAIPDSMYKYYIPPQCTPENSVECTGHAVKLDKIPPWSAPQACSAPGAAPPHDAPGASSIWREGRRDQRPPPLDTEARARGGPVDPGGGKCGQPARASGLHSFSRLELRLDRLPTHLLDNLLRSFLDCKMDNSLMPFDAIGKGERTGARPSSGALREVAGAMCSFAECTPPHLVPSRPGGTPEPIRPRPAPLSLPSFCPTGSPYTPFLADACSHFTNGGLRRLPWCPLSWTEARVAVRDAGRQPVQKLLSWGVRRDHAGGGDALSRVPRQPHGRQQQPYGGGSFRGICGHYPG